MRLLGLEDVHCHFDGVRAVDGVTLAVQRGEFVTLLGPSGCGKTTTLRLVAGFEALHHGRIWLGGQVIADTHQALAPSERNVGMVFQDYALFSHLNVLHNVMFGVRGSRQVREQRAHAMLALVGLEGYGARMPHALSGGQQQRVALARALAPQPDVLLLDEPFSNLDAALRAQVRGEVRAILRQTGITCVFVTHDQDEALSLSDRVAVMFDGRVAQVGSPRAVYQQPASARVATFVGEANLLPADASAEHAVCALGTVPLARAAHGPVTLMIRPENLVVGLANNAPGVTAHVAWQDYHGHHMRVGLALADGTTLTVRQDPTVSVTDGQAVTVALYHSAHVLAAS